MGSGAWTSSSWNSYKSSSGISSARSASDIYSKSTSNKYLPYNVVRESCDSTEHPNSTPIILGLDVTGSMSRVLHVMADKLGVTVGEIYNRKVVTDPQILFSAIDDYESSDNECIQVTQFEADIRIAEQLRELNFIGYGAGNGHESYALSWYFAARHTKCDAIAKGRKGIIITMGDDGVKGTIDADEVNVVFGDTIESMSTRQLLAELNRNWEVFHISVAEGGSYSNRVKNEWEDMLGSHALVLEDVTKLPELIVSILQSLRGDDIDTIAGTWDGSTGVVIRDTLRDLVVSKGSSDEVVVF